MFYTAKENVSPHDFDYLLNPYEFCTDVDEGSYFKTPINGLTVRPWRLLIIS